MKFFLALAAIFAAGAPAQTNPPALQFTPFGQGLPTSGQWREGFRIADLNGDGHPDLVHGPPRKQSSFPVIFLGDGKGSFTRWKEARFPELDYDYGDVEVADFNSDGHADIAVAIHFGAIVILTGDGHGNFTADPKFELRSPAGFSSRAIRATRWNGNPPPGLAAVWEGPRPGTAARGVNGLLLFQHGDGGWTKAERTLSPGIYSDSLAIGDFDGDGHPDVASGSSVMGRKDLVNLWSADGGRAAAPIPIPGGFHYVQSVAAGDFDNDGKDDLAVGYLTLENEVWYSVIDIFFSRAGGKWERKELSREATRSVAASMATGHLLNKGTRDLVAVTTAGQTIVFAGDGHGKFVRHNEIPVYGGGCRGSHVELADLDGDGFDEIITSFADEPNGTGPGAVCPTGGGFAAWKAIPR